MPPRAHIPVEYLSQEELLNIEQLLEQVEGATHRANRHEGDSGSGRERVEFSGLQAGTSECRSKSGLPRCPVSLHSRRCRKACSALSILEPRSFDGSGGGTPPADPEHTGKHPSSTGLRAPLADVTDVVNKGTPPSSETTKDRDLPDSTSSCGVSSLTGSNVTPVAPSVMANPSPEVKKSLNQRLIEVEEVGLQLDRRQLFRRHGLCVTDVTSSEWCQQQTAFKLSCSVRVESREMQVGSSIHQRLEAETMTTVVLPEEEVQTAEDFWALQLLTSHLQLMQLLETGLTRELFVIGKLGGRWMSGKIDQLELATVGQAHVSITEVKTRRHASMPQTPQHVLARLQVMLYAALFNAFKHSSMDILLQYFTINRKLNVHHLLSHQVQQYAREVIGRRPQSLADVILRVHQLFKFLPDAGEQHRVIYLWQANPKVVIGSEEVVLDQEWMMDRLQHHLAFWEGKAPPQRVEEREELSLKCKRCAFRPACRPELSP